MGEISASIRLEARSYVLKTNRTLQNPFWCFIFWGIHILRLNILKNRENGDNMHQNGHIWYFLAIFFCWSLSASLWACFMSKGWAYFTHLKKWKRFHWPKFTNIEKMAILSGMLAILGDFLRVSPDDHLDTCFSYQWDFTESTLVLYIRRYSDFKSQNPK